ncbi:hypothetical protein BH11GEM2_BH11GEM2_25620 [soil metagenome]
MAWSSHSSSIGVGPRCQPEPEVEGDEGGRSCSGSRHFPYMLPAATDDWATPEALFDVLRASDDFNLDPCASHTNHKCARHFTEAENGLLQDWRNHSDTCPEEGISPATAAKACVDRDEHSDRGNR